ncbi:hypothetical protein F4774DRAFT_317948 [Daldinia eschscholtzii]|nr:hypothetical protein F4774DRAFT_317948 [Daldinia eschscholtzii]
MDQETPNDYYENHGNAPRVQRSREFARHSGEGVQNVNGSFQNDGDFNILRVSGNNISIGSPFVTQGENKPKDLKKHRLKALKSLKFAQIDERQNNIKDAHAKTNKWLLETPEFIDWLDFGRFSDHNGLLWIKGKPGAGKSTLMKSAISQVYQLLTDQGNMVISFFFNARGERMEKSTSGLYRSLLIQLFKLDPALQEHLDSFDFTVQWSIGRLKDLFEKTILGIRKPAVICFIDALDECEDQQIRDMLYFLRNVGQKASLHGTRLHICLASRHYPHITVPKGLTLVIEHRQEHSQDITKYLKDELRIGEDDFADRIRSKVQEKASNVFMWVVLVVDILNKEYDRGRKHTLGSRLKKLPSDLHELFEDMLTRGDDNREGLLLCMQWILFAVRPMRLEELYFAIISGIESESLSICHAENTISFDDMRRYIIDNSKGLADVSGLLSTVQFIHESVRDFLLIENGLQKLSPGQTSNPHGFGHDILKQCCLTYIRDAFRGDKFRANTKFPFLDYTTTNILVHAERAERSGVAQGKFISEFPLKMWIKCNSACIKRGGMPASSSDIEYIYSESTLLYILASLNFPRLIRTRAAGYSCFAREEGRYGTPIFAALARRSYEAFESLLEIQMHSMASKHSFDEEYDQSGYKDLFDPSFNFSPEKGVPHYVLESENIRLFEAFLLSERTVSDFELLQLALNKGNRLAARKLIDRITKFELPDKEPLLVTATKKRHIDFVQLLLHKGLNIEGNTQYRSPLQEAIILEDMQLIQFFIEKGANINGNEEYRSPLQEAVFKNNKELIQLLFQNGADVEGNGKYSTPLQDAVIRGSSDLVRMLLEKGASVEGRHSFTNPLLFAVGQGYGDIVQLLLRKNANTRVRGYPNSPLALAIRGGHEAIAELLLRHGARDEPWALVGSRLLVSAVSRRQVRVVGALLASGIEAQGHDIPFQRLALSPENARDRAIVQLLVNFRVLQARSDP